MCWDRERRGARVRGRQNKTKKGGGGIGQGSSRRRLLIHQQWSNILQTDRLAQSYEGLEIQTEKRVHVHKLPLTLPFKNMYTITHLLHNSQTNSGFKAHSLTHTNNIAVNAKPTTMLHAVQ